MRAVRLFGFGTLTPSGRCKFARGIRHADEMHVCWCDGHIVGVVAAAFDHWDFRAGEPQLDTHVVVMNWVQNSDGVWRTLDSRGLLRSTAALSEMYNGVPSDHLRQALGWGGRRAGGGTPASRSVRLPGSASGSRGLLSERSPHNEAAKDVLVAAFVTSRGRQPTAREVLPLRHQAILQTRTEKHVRPLADLVDGWRGRAREVLDPDPVSWVETSPAATTSLAASRAPCRRDVGRSREGGSAHGGGEAGDVRPVERVRRSATSVPQGPVRRRGRPDDLRLRRSSGLGL